MRQLTKEEKEALWIALNLRSSHIETGTHLRAKDVERMGSAAPKEVKIKALGNDQMRLILLNDELTQKIFEGKVFLSE